jgi:hypothetical protein
MSLRPTSRALGTANAPRAPAQVGAGMLNRLIVAIGSHSLAALHNWKPARNFRRWGQGLVARKK